MWASRVRSWLVPNWFGAGLITSVFLFGLTPILLRYVPHGWVLVYLQLPVYMVHQVEEHYHDRFRIAINELLAGGRDALTHDAVLVVNLGGVWGYDVVAIYLAYVFGAGAGLMAMYLAMVNAVVHAGSAVVERRYNPGVVTALVLLLPAGIAGCWQLRAWGLATTIQQWYGLGAAIAVHAVIVAHVARRRARLLRGA